MNSLLSCRLLNAANTRERNSRLAGSGKGTGILGTYPANKDEYDNLQEAWQKVEHTTEIKCSWNLPQR